MMNMQKVVWAEGVMLSQQHMQHSEAYQQYKHSQIAHAIQPYLWGLLSFTIDLQRLAQGIFQLKQCQWLLREGELLDVQDAQGGLQLNLAEYNQAEIDIYLIQAVGKLCADIPGYKTSEHLSWRAKHTELIDQFDTQRVNQVLVASPVVELVVGKPAGDVNTIQIARVMRNQYGEYRLSETFIPSVLQSKQSSVLTKQLKDYLALASEKNQELKNTKELSAKMLSSILGGAIVQLQSWVKNFDTHPSVVYTEISKLIGNLAVYHDDINLSEISSYDQDNLTTVFSDLYALMNKVMQVNLKSRIAEVHFSRQSENVYVTDLIENDIINNYEFFVAVKVSSDTTTWIDEFIHYVKLGSSNMIEMIVASALPGLIIRYLQHMPSNFPNKPGFQYFHIQKQGDFWQQVQQQKQIALFLAQQFESATIELLVLRGADETD